MQLIRNGLDLTIIPEVHKRTLIWIHGFNDTAELFCQDFLQEPLVADCKVVLPTAHEYPSGNRTVRSWHSIPSNSSQGCSLESSICRVLSILDEESKFTDCLLIGGFSQGATLSLVCGLCRFSGHISGIIALSGIMINKPIPSSRKSIPVLLYHGLLDNRISFNKAKKSFESYLKGVEFTLEVNPSMII